MAFCKCYALSSINFPASVSSIGENLWFECANLNDFYVDANNPNYCAIDGVLFSKDTKTLVYYPVKREGTYIIPEGTEAINSFAFSCSRLERIDIPSSVTSIGEFSMRFMLNIIDIAIPSTVTCIGEGALRDCHNLKSVVLPERISLIPKGLFFSCVNLRNITIPSTVTSIGDYAFSYSGLKKVTSLMETPCAISPIVFDNINPSAVLYVPEESVTAYKEAEYWKDFSMIVSIDEDVNEPYAEFNNSVLSFYNDSKREERSGETYEIPFGLLPTIEWYDKNSCITKIVFDASFADVRPTMTSNWFDGCEKLTKIEGLENLNTSEVTNMVGMYQNCGSLTSIDLSGFNTDKVNSMSGMFWGCRNLKTVIHPSNLKFIDSYQFAYCSSLEEISIPESVTTIGEHAFDWCSSLTRITIPSNVTFIGDNAFSGSGLIKVTSLMQAPCAISSTVFENVSSNATLYVPAGSKTIYEAADNWKDFKKIMGPSFVIKYMVDGEQYKSYEIEAGEILTSEPAPAKFGYSFSGWSEIPKTMPDHDVIVNGTFEESYNVGHVVTMVDVLMNPDPSEEDIAYYDMNGDEELNIGDVILVVKSILNHAPTSARTSTRRAPSRTDYAQYTAAQFELKVDEGTTINNISLVDNMSQTHQVMYQQKDDNTYAVVIYSMSNQLMNPQGGNIIEIETDGSDATIQNITVATPTGETYVYQDGGMITGIHNTEKNRKSAVIYDLKGNRLNEKELQNGLYIINGKKAVVK